jgi:quercetin dioxygenase-like cupin family protein
MPVIRNAQRRRTETPNAVMTTLASPGQGGAATAMWRVDMQPGQAGPLHAIDAEQILTVLEGGASVLLGTDTIEVGPGDTVVMPADVPRRITADPRLGVVAIGTAPAGMLAYALDGSVVGAHCATPVGDKLVPAWVA